MTLMKTGLFFDNISRAAAMLAKIPASESGLFCRTSSTGPGSRQTTALRLFVATLRASSGWISVDIVTRFVVCDFRLRVRHPKTNA